MSGVGVRKPALANPRPATGYLTWRTLSACAASSSRLGLLASYSESTLLSDVSAWAALCALSTAAEPLCSCSLRC